MDTQLGRTPLREPIRPPRKILCTGALATVVLAAAGATALADSPLSAERADLRAAELSQAGRNLVLSLRTAAPLPLSELDRTPAVRSGESRYLCLAMQPLGRRGGRRICLGGSNRPRQRAGLELVNGRGGTTAKSLIAVRLRRPAPLRLVVALRPQAAALPPHRYRWRVVENRTGCLGCATSLPAAGNRSLRLRPVRAVGCTGGSGGLVTNGPRDRPVVALTFDDGPSEYTDSFLDVLRRKHARGTFFEIGQEVGGRSGVMRRILREGSEIGNHTMHHDFFPGYWDLAATSAVIRSATHFQPCLFRPPGGALNGAVIGAAAEADMKTVTWDVDPGDWRNPGSAAVYSRVVAAARPGSIILMHDGGGDRSGTLEALPAIIDALRQRGYRFATVSALLGRRLVYRPYG